MALCSTEGVPHKGWQEVRLFDLHDDDGRKYGDYLDCEFCGHEQIRFVHTLEHRSYPTQIQVGCICACNLTDDYKNPKLLERQLRNRANRRAKFPDRAWKTTRHGGDTIALDGYRITVGQLRNGRYRLWINSKQGTREYPDLRMAKLCAFDAVQKMKQKEDK